MTLIVNDRVHLSELRPSDANILAEHLNDREFHDRTLRIPFPYTMSDAQQWLALVNRVTEHQGRPVHWAIREADETLIGVCGFDDFQLGKSHRAEVGYWLAKALWGQGVMTAVVARICRVAFEEFRLTKITAHVLPQNGASVRVLEKSGFQQEGHLRRHFRKDGKFFDVKLFALVRQQV